MPAWLLWTLLTLAAWGGWAFLSRLLGSALTAEQNQALSTLGFLPVLALLALSGRGRLRRASRRGLLLALAGGVVSCLANIPYYAAAARGERFASVISLVALAPVVTVLLALVLLREKLGAVQAAGLGLAFVAIWLFNVSDGAGLLSPTVVVALPPILLWGLSGFLQKLATQDTSAEAAALVYLGAFVPMGVWYALREPWPAEVTGRTWALVVALGFLLAFGNFAVLAAYAAGGKAAVVAPLVNLFPLVSIGLALLLLGEKIGAREALGVAVALASVAALSREPVVPHSPIRHPHS
ncbi:MAG: EamA family transporter [Limisphaerales bacterium]